VIYYSRLSCWRYRFLRIINDEAFRNLPSPSATAVRGHAIVSDDSCRPERKSSRRNNRAIRCSACRGSEANHISACVMRVESALFLIRLPLTPLSLTLLLLSLSLSLSLPLSSSPSLSLRIGENSRARSCANSQRVVFAGRAGIVSDSWLFIIPGLPDWCTSVEARGREGGREGERETGSSQLETSKLS